jgi:predicted RNase H-like nuclease (RuvC/YqgF family)
MEEKELVQEPVLEEPVQMSQEDIIRMLVDSLQAKDKEIESLKTELQLMGKELGHTKKELEQHELKCSMPTPAPEHFVQEFIRRELDKVKKGIEYLRHELKQYPEDKFLKIRLEQALHVKNFLEEKGGHHVCH